MQQDFKFPGNNRNNVPPKGDPILPAPVDGISQTPLLEINPAPRKKSQKSKVILGLLVSFVMVVIFSSVGISAWYSAQLQPKDPGAQQQKVNIAQGTALIALADQLESEGIIKNSVAFQAYVRVKGLQGELKAGAYVLSPSQSVPEIAALLAEGKVDSLTVTLVPGQTVKEIAVALEGYGFSKESIDEALSTSYNHPLLVSKPAGESLEGYIYPETYQIAGSGSVGDLLLLSFDTFYEKIQEKRVLDKLSQRKMTLHQGVTFASVVQKEVSNEDDQRQVAQVFHKRLSENMPLQSDPTFVYPAKQAGKKPTVDIVSPYNTYLHRGLPPGPIANFNLSALLAVVEPASGDFLYFVADENGTTHYAKTLQEHNANVEKYCTAHCNDF